MIENISNENVFIKEEKILYEKKEVLNYSMIFLLSGLKENSDVDVNVKIVEKWDF